MTKIAPEISPDVLGLPPRNVALTGSGWYSVTVLVVILVCTAVLPSRVQQQRNDRLHALQIAGVPVAGTVTACSSSGDVKYTYRANYSYSFRGQYYTGQTEQLSSEYPRHEVGSLVTIYVLPLHPEQSHLGPVTTAYIQRTSNYLHRLGIQTIVLALILNVLMGKNIYQQWRMLKYGKASQATVVEINPGKSANMVLVACTQDESNDQYIIGFTGYRRVFSDLCAGSKLTYLYHSNKPDDRMLYRSLLVVRFVERSVWQRS